MRTSPLKAAGTSRHRMARGFTLIETLITLTVLAIVAVAIMLVVNGLSHNKQSTTNAVEAQQAAATALDMMTSELRSAGYGSDANYTGDPQPAIAYIDSAEVIFCANFSPWPDSTLNHQGPLAYDPDGDPKPKPLDGTSWEPNQKYRTGAELVRYTLDANNDGQISSADQTTGLGADAQRTRNPNDYMLIRQVYGDSTNNLAHNNGGTSQSIALVRRPGGGVPSIFTVYMKGSATPYDWANGPVPADKLSDIDRITVKMTASSPQPDARGNYAMTTLQTTINSTRNVPNFLTNTYPVEGYVFNDNITPNGTQDSGEPGIANVLVQVGNSYTTQTSANGYYLLRVPAGSYTLRHTPIPGYGSSANPDTFSIAVGPGVQRSFADTSARGGYVSVNVYNDQNGNGLQDAGEPGIGYIQTTISPSGSTNLTDLNGAASVFSGVGFYSILVSVPDSLSATTPNPITGVMVNGGTAGASVGLHRSTNGFLTGTVYNDLNRNGVQDAGEPGTPNVWVCATKTGTTAGFGYSDNYGNFTVAVPYNNPPMTTPYLLYFIPPAGYYPTTSQVRYPLYVTAGGTVSGNTFGIAAYQVIALTASRVLSLASADLIENDWGATPTNNRQDVDLILGADAGGTDNISVWFNQYNSTTLFTATPTTTTTSGYTRNAPQSVQTIAIDTLDSNAPRNRPDMVTGTKAAATGNFFVWFSQNTSGNEGYFPATFSTNQNYWTNDAGDVTSVVTLDCSGGSMPDLIVGTRSPTAGNGTIEIWENSNAATPVFTRQEIYPTTGNVPGNRMGEVVGMAVYDFDGDGIKDLVVADKTGNYSGELLVFQGVGRTNGNRFSCISNAKEKFDNDAPTSLVLADIDGDGKKDIVIGTQTGTTTGNLLHFHNNCSAGHFDFPQYQSVTAPGIVLSVAAGDLGGTNRSDLVVGWRTSTSSYLGGSLVYYTDSGMIPPYGTDPANGGVPYMVPAICINNFNYGVKPVASTSPFLQDIAVGVKITDTLGALVVFVR